MAQSLKKKKLWIQRAKDASNAIDLPAGTFTHSSTEIAQLLKQAVIESKRAEGTEFKSAISMLDSYIKRAGKNLQIKERARLEQAKIELRKLFGKI